MKLQSVEEFFYKRETVEKYNDDKITYINQKSMSEYDYISKQMQSAKRG